MSTTPDRTPQRVRHELRRRTLTVLSAERVTPHLVRITLGGEELAGFTSPGFDDHVKLFFPDPATGELHLPEFGPQGPVKNDGPKPTARDYTPRRYDPAAGTLEIDFALHEAGPATRWAENAAPGDTLTLGGPRGSFIVPTDFDGHVLVGDDTALPAIFRRLAELPPGAPASVLAEVDDEADRIALPSAANVSVTWVYRARGEDLVAALDSLAIPAGDVYAWVACETGAAKAIRARLIERGLAPRWIKAAGYWRRGAVASHDTIED